MHMMHTLNVLLSVPVRFVLTSPPEYRHLNKVKNNNPNMASNKGIRDIRRQFGRRYGSR
jgi:hypothetical protein